MMADLDLHKRFALLRRSSTSLQWDLFWVYDFIGEDDLTIEGYLSAWSFKLQPEFDGVAVWDFFDGTVTQLLLFQGKSS